MARYSFDKNLNPVIEAAQLCIRRCLVGDGSVFSEQSLWTTQGFEALHRHFVQQPDEGAGTFYEKLRGQMAAAPPAAVRLMAEALWLLLLFPSNISTDTKRDNCIEVWSWSGETLDPQHPLLADAVLRGIGSAGMGMNTNRWREVNYLVGLGLQLKALPQPQREAIFASYDSFAPWLATVPQEGERQFRHMLRYFLFPDRVERMSSNRDRRSVLAAYGVAEQKACRNWSDSQLDEALFLLRQKLEAEHRTDKLDFYAPPLRARWKPDEEDDRVQPAVQVYPGVREPAPAAPAVAGTARPARNVIYYGPPGTGKTEKLRELFNEYTDPVADIDRRSWEIALVAGQGWRAVIAVALAQLGGAARVGDIAAHALILAKAAERRRSGNLLATLWGYLQSHADPASTTIGYTNRREPFLFDKDTNAHWRLLPHWRERDPEAANLLQIWEKGPGAGREPVRRYRVVTFHPSYSYEDFVIGLRPVTDDDAESGAAPRFALVDGVFKQICQQARANPARRYALFIDEINRANIAKVFGELITLVESDKRARYEADGRLAGGLEVQLPGAGELLFGVPANLDIYASMNTADRSIALLDIALRRRFAFEELAPRYEPLDRPVAGVHLGRLLRMINRRLEYLLDRDHCIGHGYLWNICSLEELQAAFARQILPLLQEYFFDDWSRVAAVLSDADGACAFLHEERIAARSLFGCVGDLEPERCRYNLTPVQSWSAEVFRGIYERTADDEDAA